MPDVMTSEIPPCDPEPVLSRDVVDTPIVVKIEDTSADESHGVAGEYGVMGADGPSDGASLADNMTSEDENGVTTTSPQGDGVMDNNALAKLRAEPTKTRGQSSQCKVCGDDASGMYFGALVCVPCKTFFLRYAGEGKKFVCKYWRNCDVTVATRTQCKCCRYQKCLMAGMRRRVRPIQVQIGEGQQLCAVCSDVGNGIHFGVVTCEGCKKFFRRGLVENASYRCKNLGVCSINPQTRNLCRYCRYRKCIEMGMSRTAIQMGRPTKYSHASGSEGSPTVSNSDATSEMNATTSFQVIRPFTYPIQLQTFNQQIGFWNPQQLISMAAQPLYPAIPVNGLRSTTAAASSPTQSVLPDSTVAETERSDVSKHREAAKRPSTDEAMDLRHPKVMAGTPPADIKIERAELNTSSALPPAFVLSWLSLLRPYAMNNGLNGAAAFGQDLIQNSLVKGEDASKKQRSSNSEPAMQDSSSTTVGSASNTKTDLHSDDTAQPLSPVLSSSQVDLTAADGELEDFSVDQLMSLVWNYWLLSSQQIADCSVSNHWDVINQIVPIYNRFVHHGASLNRMLRDEYEQWSSKIKDISELLPDWIKIKVIPAFTVASVSYCKGLPGFEEFDADDQATIIRIGQSSSRILLAAVQWYDVDTKAFRSFLAWRPGTDVYKKRLLDYAESISILDVDPIEAALLNALLIVATDYPNLRNPGVIQQTRHKILSSLQTYINGKYGGPNTRIKSLFGCVPEARRLGLLYYQMSRTRTMSAEEVEQKSTPFHTTSTRNTTGTPTAASSAGSHIPPVTADRELPSATTTTELTQVRGTEAPKPVALSTCINLGSLNLASVAPGSINLPIVGGNGAYILAAGSPSVLSLAPGSSGTLGLPQSSVNLSSSCTGTPLTSNGCNGLLNLGPNCTPLPAVNLGCPGAVNLVSGCGSSSVVVSGSNVTQTASAGCTLAPSLGTAISNMDSNGARVLTVANNHSLLVQTGAPCYGMRNPAALNLTALASGVGLDAASSGPAQQSSSGLLQAAASIALNLTRVDNDAKSADKT